MDSGDKSAEAVALLRPNNVRNGENAVERLTRAAVTRRMTDRRYIFVGVHMLDMSRAAVKNVAALLGLAALVMFTLSNHPYRIVFGILLAVGCVFLSGAAVALKQLRDT
jgi:hypothetical protein